jgi:hypothetical protein
MPACYIIIRDQVVPVKRFHPLPVRVRAVVSGRPFIVPGHETTSVDQEGLEPSCTDYPFCSL